MLINHQSNNFATCLTCTQTENEITVQGKALAEEYQAFGKSCTGTVKQCRVIGLSKNQKVRLMGITENIW